MSKSWYDCSAEPYKRTNKDSPLRCPHCDRQFTMNGRSLDYYRAIRAGKVPTTTCKHCGNEFYYMNYTAKYCRENNVKATYKK